MTTPIRVFLVDRYAVVRTGVRSLLMREQRFTVLGEAGCPVEALPLALRLQPELIVMDLILPLTHSLEFIRQVRHNLPACQVVILSERRDEESVRGAIRVGAVGYLAKEMLPPDLLPALCAAARGEPTLHAVAQRVLMRQISAPVTPLPKLTRRECSVLQLMSQGRCNKEIARALYLTEGTVKGYVSAILGKLAVDDRTQAALYAVRHRLFTPA